MVSIGPGLGSKSVAEKSEPKLQALKFRPCGFGITVVKMQGSKFGLAFLGGRISWIR